MKSILQIRATWRRIARHFINEKLLAHPLPWRIEQDWTFEVTAADGHIVVKCMTPQEARWVIKLAEELDADFKKTVADLKA